MDNFISKKYKQGDKVFYFHYGESGKIKSISEIFTVYTEPEYIYDTGLISIKYVAKNCVDAHKCLPVFIKTSKERWCCWMPENELYLATTAMLVLYDEK